MPKVGGADCEWSCANSVIVLNLSRLDYLDRSGIGDLVHTYMSVIKRGGEMKVVGLTKRVEEILKITQLHQVFQEFQDEQSAVSSFPRSGSKGARILEFRALKISSQKEEKQLRCWP